MKSKLLLSLFVATCLFSCTQENEATMPQDKSEANKVSFFVSTAPVTRTTVNTTDNSTLFVENDKIGIFEKSTSITDADNYEYKVLGDGTLEAVDALKTLHYPNDANEDIGFYAYYPFNSGAAATDKVEFTVAADQSSEALYNANDFMAATATGKKADFADGVSLKFSHQLALVQLSLIGDDAVNVTAVTLNNCQPTTTWTFLSTKITSGTAQDIKMWKIKPDVQTYWALVPAQTIATGTVLFTMTAGATTYTYKPSASNIVLTANKIKKFNIQLGTNGNTIAVSTDMNTDGWDDTDSAESGKGETTVPKPVELVTNGDMESMQVGEITTVGTDSKNNGTWYVMKKGTTVATASIIDEGTPQNKVMNYNITTWANWYSSYIAYRLNTIEKAQYKLSFKIKGSGSTVYAYIKSDDTTDANGEGSGKNNFFTVISEESTSLATKQAGSKITLSDTWTEYTITLDFNELIVGSPNSATNTVKATTAAALNGCYIGFTTYPAAANFYIDDVSLTKVIQ